MKSMKNIKKRKYLFVCQHNFTRSRYGAEFLSGFLDGRGISAQIDSAGLGIASYFLGKRINHKFLKDVDIVFVMENYMKDYLECRFCFDKSKIVVLNIKDDYGFLKRKSIKELDKLLRRVKWQKYLK